MTFVDIPLLNSLIFLILDRRHLVLLLPELDTIGNWHVRNRNPYYIDDKRTYVGPMLTASAPLDCRRRCVTNSVLKIHDRTGSGSSVLLTLIACISKVVQTDRTSTQTLSLFAFRAQRKAKAYSYHPIISQM